MAKDDSGEAEARAWRAVLPLVHKLKGFFLFSKELNALIPKILLALCTHSGSNSSYSLAEQLEEHQVREGGRGRKIVRSRVIDF